MPILTPRARLLALATLLAAAAALALFAWIGARIGQSEPGLSLPSTLPTVPRTQAPSGVPDPSGSPVPQPEILMAVGDIGSCDNQADEALAELASQLRGTIALLGDLAYENGTAEQFAECFDPVWRTLLERIRPVPGNHDVRRESGAAYYAYFGAAAGEPGHGWYSYDLGAWHIVALNSNCDVVGCGAGSPQVDWLREDLAANPSDCLLAYWHHPRWSSGKHGSQPQVDEFWRALSDAGADVIINGHDHTYERVLRDGIRQWVVGTGGRSLYPFEKPRLDETELRSDESYGLLWLALSGNGTYNWEYLTLGNPDFRDGGHGEC